MKSSIKKKIQTTYVKEMSVENSLSRYNNVIIKIIQL